MNEDAPWTRGGEPSLLDHFIAWRTLEPRLQTLAGAALGGAGAAAIGLMTKDYAGPVLSIGKSMATIPWPDALAALGLFIAALSFLCFGLAQAAPRGRIAGIAIFLILVAIAFPHPGASAPRAVGTVAAIMGWSVANMLWLAWVFKRKQPHPTLLAATAIVFAAGLAGISLLQPEIGFLYFAVILQFPLLALFLIAGTDWAEMTDGAVCASARALLGMAAKKSVPVRSLLPFLTMLVAATILCLLYLLYWSQTWDADWITDKLRGVQGEYSQPSTAQIGISLLRGAMFVPVFWLALRAAAVRLLAERPPSWLNVAAVAVTIAIILLKFNWVPDPMTASVLASGKMAALLLASLAGLYMIRRFPLLERAAPGFLLAALAAGILVFFAQPEDVLLCVSAGTLIVLGGLWASRHRFTDIGRPAYLLLVLNISLAGLLLLYRLAFPVVFRGLTEGNPLAAGIALFLFLLWDLLVSGHGVTNRSNALFPRRARVLLFLGYVTGAAGFALLFGSIHADATQVVVWQALGDGDTFVRSGIAILGQALLCTLFVQRFLHWQYTEDIARKADSIPLAGAAPAIAS